MRGRGLKGHRVRYGAHGCAHSLSCWAARGAEARTRIDENCRLKGCHFHPQSAHNQTASSCHRRIDGDTWGAVGGELARKVVDVLPRVTRPVGALREPVLRVVSALEGRRAGRVADGGQVATAIDGEGTDSTVGIGAVS